MGVVGAYPGAGEYPVTGVYARAGEGGGTDFRIGVNVRGGELVSTRVSESKTRVESEKGDIHSKKNGIASYI